MSNYKVKVSIIGDFAVGKSSILNVLNDKMDYCTQSTLGVDFFYKIFSYEEQSYKFHIWDTAGQERFRTIVRSYFRDLDVVILVYDVTDMYSLDNLEKWDADILKELFGLTTYLIIGISFGIYCIYNFFVIELK